MTAAPEEQREELLNDLLKFSNLGIPDFRAAYTQVYQASEQLIYRYTRLQSSLFIGIPDFRAAYL